MTFGKVSRAVAVAAALVVGSKALAHSLTDHRLITNHAITEFNFCFQGLLSAGLADSLQEHVRDEDTNLVRKWALYSHFYHPHKELEDLSRLDSSLRIALLQKEIKDALGTSDLDDWSDAFDEMGHAIHHIQDMTSPPHVVPVMHNMFDGFEGYELSYMDYPDIRLDEAHCQRLLQNRKPMGLFQVLKETAAHTLRTLDTQFRITYDGSPRLITWKNYFWKEASGNVFGEYGYLGNRFGETNMVFAPIMTVQVPRATYREFKKARLREAIDRTVESLVWFFFHN